MTAKPSPARAWAFDADRCTIGFSARHMVVATARGKFTRWTGKIDYDETDVESSSVAVEIDAASIDTQDATRDAYLKSAEFLDVDAFPRIVFTSKRVERAGRKWRVTGLLTIRDVSRAVVLDVTHAAEAAQGDRVRFVAKTIVDRKAFGLRFGQVPDVGGVAVANRIEVSIAVELVPVGAPKNERS